MKKQRSDIAFAIKLQITFFTNLVVLCGLNLFIVTTRVRSEREKLFFKAPMTLCGFLS